ncbi:uncharacterized protein ARB_02881 [Trichophyton benhamiae CBS 112371]|uniref:Uncharacterized protein n=1 Tax=Arthroderma benhamiae (strain ATCC MYA-4681 / CBS 112371) TaxID=663331 RepID=D4B347_ARTBC|nr:uncharacterized protein ARB_02881 [Trichophyton benhamiae CBS 112371]EFE30202.1 hypothetical protein ARB_02881 [Trichophyton benhamiae CBS 112371]
MYIAQSMQGYADFHAVSAYVFFTTRIDSARCPANGKKTGVIHAQRAEARRKRWKLPVEPPKKVVKNSVALCHRLCLLPFPRPLNQGSQLSSPSTVSFIYITTTRFRCSLFLLLPLLNHTMAVFYLQTPSQLRGLLDSSTSCYQPTE